ncbi:hypothetical protein GCM10027589_23170 [Actinocorallia lasiicapitis]
MATRLDRIGLTFAEIRAGLAMTLIEDSPEALGTALADQAKIESTV